MKIDCRVNLDEAAIMDKTGKIGRKIATAWVEIEDCFKFPVTVRTYQDKDTGKEKFFVAYPQRKTKGGYESIVCPKNPEIRKEIETSVLTAINESIMKTMEKTPITEVRISSITSEENPSIKAVASIDFAGLTLNGLMIREGENGLYVQMPQYMAEGSWRNYAYASTSSMQTEVETEVLQAYRRQQEILKKEETLTPVERFLAKYTGDPKELFEVLEQSELKIEPPQFINSDNQLVLQEAVLEEKEYQMLFRFENFYDMEKEWNPQKQESDLSQSITSVIVKDGEVVDIKKILELESKDATEAKRNYDRAVDFWKKITYRETMPPQEHIREIIETEISEQASVEQFMERFKAHDPEGMLEVLGKAELKIEQPDFTQSKLVASQEVSFSNEEYQISFFFENLYDSEKEWNPHNQENNFSQSIRATIMQGEKQKGKMSFVKLTSMDTVEAEKNYTMALALWKEITHQEELVYQEMVPVQEEVEHQEETQLQEEQTEEQTEEEQVQGVLKETDFMEQFLAAYETQNTEEMLIALKDAAHTSNFPEFAENGNVIAMHSSEYREGDYKVSLRFYNEWDPGQEIPPDVLMKQRIVAVIFKDNQMCGICNLVDLKSESIIDAKNNYEKLESIWKDMLGIKSIWTKKPELNVTHAEPAILQPRL